MSEMQESEAPTAETAEVAAPPKKKRNWFYLLLKIAFFFGAFMLVVLTVMANVGGKSETLRQSIEQFITENTSYSASVAHLNAMTFFPDIVLDFEKTELREKESTDLAMTADHVLLAFGFWDVMASTGKIKALSVDNLRVRPGIFISPSFEAESVKIVESVDGPRLEGKGSVGAEKFNFSTDMNSRGSGRRKRYFFGNERAFFLNLGSIKISGIMKTGESSGLVIENLDVKQDGRAVMSGMLGFVRNDGVLGLEGRLEMAEHGSVIKPDIDISIPARGKSFAVTGRVESEPGKFHPEDFAPGSAYDRLAGMIEKIFSPDEEAYTPALELDKGGAPEKLPMQGWRVKTGELKSAP